MPILPTVIRNMRLEKPVAMLCNFGHSKRLEAHGQPLVIFLMNISLFCLPPVKLIRSALSTQEGHDMLTKSYNPAVVLDGSLQQMWSGNLGYRRRVSVAGRPWDGDEVVNRESGPLPSPDLSPTPFIPAVHAYPTQVREHSEMISGSRVLSSPRTWVCGKGTRLPQGECGKFISTATTLRALSQSYVNKSARWKRLSAKGRPRMKMIDRGLRSNCSLYASSTGSGRIINPLGQPPLVVLIFSVTKGFWGNLLYVR